MIRRLMTLAAAGGSFFLVASIGVAFGQDTPAPPPLYWTFPVDHTFLELGGPYAHNDPFNPADQPPPKSPPTPVTWPERPDFFLVGSIYDAAPILREAGIQFQEGRDLAFFHQGDQLLYVRCSRESADLIDQFTTSMGPDRRARNLEIDVILVGLNDPAMYHALADAEDPRSMAESLAADAGKILARTSILTRSGQRAAIGQVAPGEAWPADQVPADKPSEGASKPADPRGPGLRLEVEPTLGGDGNTMDLSLDCTFGLLPGPSEAPLITGRLLTAVSVQSGRTLPQRLSLEGAPWREAAVLLTATIRGMDWVGWKDGIRLLTPREKRWRALGETPEKKAPPDGDH